MALMDWKSLPDTSTPLTPENLEHDPAELNTAIGNKVDKSGDTMTGDLTVNRGNNNTSIVIGSTSYKKQNEVRTQNDTMNVGMGVDTGGTFRIWNYTHSKEIIRTTAAGANSFNGNASTSTKATQDSDGNAINSTYLKKKNVAVGDVNITPSAAGTPTSKAVTWTSMDGSPKVVVTPNVGSALTANLICGFTGVSATGCAIWLKADNTSERRLDYIAIYK